MPLAVEVGSPLVHLPADFQPQPLPVRRLLREAVDPRINVFLVRVLEPELRPRGVDQPHLARDASQDELKAALEPLLLVPRLLPNPVGRLHVVGLVLFAGQHDLQSLR